MTSLLFSSILTPSLPLFTLFNTYVYVLVSPFGNPPPPSEAMTSYVNAPKPNAFAFQKDSPYLKLFNYYLNAMEEKGLTHQIKEKYKKLPQHCPDKSGKYDLGYINNCW